MPILMLMDWPDVTPEQYEEVRQKVDWESNVPTGAILHVAAFGDDSMVVTDVWESEEQFRTFVSERLMPVVEEVAPNLEAPTVEVFPLSDIFAVGDLTKVAEEIRAGSVATEA